MNSTTGKGFLESVARKLIIEQDISVVVQTSDIKNFIEKLDMEFEIKAEFEHSDLPGEYYISRMDQHY